MIGLMSTRLRQYTVAPLHLSTSLTKQLVVSLARHLLRHPPVDDDVHRRDVLLGGEVRGLQRRHDGPQGRPPPVSGHWNTDPQQIRAGVRGPAAGPGLEHGKRQGDP